MSVDLGRIIKITGGTAGEGTDNTRTFSLFTTDSRDVKQNGALFVAFKGEKTDGHDYVAAVLKAGENAALIEDARFLQANTVLVPSTRGALQAIARDYRQNELKNTLCIGITGSVGKTTVKEMTVKCISAALDVSYTKGNRNSQVGLPRTVLEVPEGTPVAVFEMGMSLPGEMARIANTALPDIVMVTNIGNSHIEAFGTREGIRDEKLTILQGLRSNGKVVVNGDEPLLNGIPNAVKCGIENKNNDVLAYNIISGGTFTEFDVNLFGEVFHTRVSALGIHSVYDALFAFAAGYLVGLTPEQMKNSLSDYQSVGDRQRIFTQNGVRVIADCYNASPESTAAALQVLKGFEGRKIAVLGDMLELGESASALHASIGENVKAAGVDILVTVGALAKNIANSAEVESVCFAADESDNAAMYIKKKILSGDTVLFKGSRGMHLETVMKKVFDI